MADNLVIVESPAKAKTIGKFLGKNYKIVASMGHVRDLPKSQMGVDIEHDFDPKYITIRGKGTLIAKLKKDAKSAKKVYLATDPDREGEAISWHLANILNIDDTKNCRITFNEITKKAISSSIKEARPVNMDLVDAQQARRVLDRIVGYKISPLLWRKVKKGLSAGRVQSVAMRIICDREEEILNFIEEEYWSLTAELSKKGSKTTFPAKFYGQKGKKIVPKNKEEVDVILDKLKGVDYVVDNVKESEKTKNSPFPFITSTLQQEASRKLGFTTKKTMMLAQQLYEGVDVKGKGTLGLITYIRTDSVRVSDEARDAAKEYITNRYGKEYVFTGVKKTKKNNSTQDAHEAIRPSYIDLFPADIKESLSRDQHRLYKLIWERFIASQMKAAIYDVVVADILANGFLFRANGSKIKFDGFMKVYVEGKDEEEEKEEKEFKIPELSVGEILELKDLVDKQHFTQPPPRYTEASLVKLMEEKDIGRPSTYSPTISTIIARNYCAKEKKVLFPTELGLIVNDIMKKHFERIVDLDFTANMENEFDQIEEDGIDWKEIIKKFYGPFEKTLVAAEEEIGQIEIKPEETDILCEKCGKNMIIRDGRYGKFLACPGFPDCRNTKPIVEEAGIECPKCGGKVLVKKSKTGRRFLGCEKYPECDFTSWDRETKEICPKCGKALLQRGNNLRCSNEECGYIEKRTKKEE